MSGPFAPQPAPGRARKRSPVPQALARTCVSQVSLLVNVGNKMTPECLCVRKNMRVCYAFDHKSFTVGNELCANPEIWIVASEFVPAIPFRRAFLRFLTAGG